MTLDDRIIEAVLGKPLDPDMPVPNFVEKIKQAFADEGWAHVVDPEDLTPELRAKWEDDEKAFGLMTGQEWKTKFMEELHKLQVVRIHTADGSIDSNLLYVTQVEQVAQKVASGIGEDK